MDVGLRVLVGCGVGVKVGRRVFVGLDVSVRVGRGVFVGRSVRVFVGLSVLVGRGSDVKLKVISGLWQSGSAWSVHPSPSSSMVLKQFSPGPVTGINGSGGTSQRVIESKRISASALSKVSTNRPTSPLA